MVRHFFFPCLKPLHPVVGVLVAVLVLQALQEELLWEEGVLGDATPVSLNHTVFSQRFQWNKGKTGTPPDLS